MSAAPTKQLSQIAAAKFGGTDKAIKYAALARDTALSFGEYAIGTNSTSYEPVLLRIAPDNTVRVESQVAFIKMLLDMLKTYETAGTIKREIAPLVYNAIADKLCITLTDIKPFLFKTEQNGYAWHRLAFDPDLNAPEVEEYCSMAKRTSAEAFRSQTEFFGSLLDYDFMIEQYLYLCGAGNDGKSTLVNTIKGALPPGFSSAIASDDLYATHGMAKVEGKRLLIFSEESNSSFVSGGKFKQITGRDALSINPKNQPEREIVPNCRVIVTSNPKPRVKGGSADERRILPVFYESFKDGILGDQAWQQRMMAKGPAILQYCYAQYCKNVRDVGAQRIKPDEEFMEEIRDMSSGSEARACFEKLFERCEDPNLWPTIQQAVQHAKAQVRDRVELMQLRDHIHNLPKFRARAEDGRGPRLLRDWAINGDRSFK